ncbi:hypothetical protein [[Clostridium] innocuum]|uniref:hypothetical protein n=1 Tax=Clostridium innocuum TaxID=1522 RepID=UPI001FD98AD0|nr:hypothetical protein [[Clostridium] innocuum]
MLLYENWKKLCRYDIRYRSITNGCVPSYKSFERFINHTLKESIQTIAKEIYLYVQDEKSIGRTDSLY